LTIERIGSEDGSGKAVFLVWARDLEDLLPQVILPCARFVLLLACSRAENGLALVIYTHPQLARKFFVEKGWFAADEIECVDQAGDLH
jgi:hypothetical protein